jgi:hypothetical protein
MNRKRVNENSNSRQFDKKTCSNQWILKEYASNLLMVLVQIAHQSKRPNVEVVAAQLVAVNELEMNKSALAPSRQRN